jgi:hypothetical protein
MKSKPYILGGLLLYSGYLWAFLSGVEKAIPPELVEFRRREQIGRLKDFMKNSIRKVIVWRVILVLSILKLQ